MKDGMRPEIVERDEMAGAADGWKVLLYFDHGSHFAISLVFHSFSFAFPITIVPSGEGAGSDFVLDLVDRYIIGIIRAKIESNINYGHILGSNERRE